MSIKERQGRDHLVEQDLALKVYIESLLLESSEPAVSSEPIPITVQQAISSKTTVAPTDSAIAENISPVVEGVERADDSLYPEWAQAPFQSLLFDVCGFLTFAVPLIKLNGIIPWSDEITPTPNHPEWFLGLLSHRGNQVKVIDIAKFVVPENHQARQAVDSKREMKKIVLIDDSSIGLACDDIGDVLALDKDKIRWRGEQSSRPWLAGMVKEEMCALLDVEKFADMLKKGVKRDEYI